MVGLSATVGIAGCNGLAGDDPDQQSPHDRTPTTVLTPTPPTGTEPTEPSESPTLPISDTDSPTKTPSPVPTPTIAEMVSTPALAADSSPELDEFGHAVALSQETAIVLAEEYGAYVFDAEAGWTNTAVLTPNDREDFGGYHASAALVDDEAVIGGPGVGAAYLFERTDDSWTQRHRFTPEKDANEFGRSLAFDGDRVVVGDAHDPGTMVTWIGHGYVFRREGEDWIQEAALSSGDQDLFGTAIAVDGETVLIGAPYAEPDGAQTGAVYVYDLVDGTWQRQSVLSPTDSTGADDGLFGQAVALDGEIAAVGAPEIESGRAYVFERSDTGWDLQASVTTPQADESADFGQSVALADGRLLVGAPHANVTGRAFVFTASDGWTKPLRLRAADAHEDAEFGADVALAGETALVGAPVFRAASGAYLFEL